MLSNKEIICPNNLLDIAHKKKGVKVAVVNAGKPCQCYQFKMQSMKI